MTTTTCSPCAICGSVQWIALPEIGPASMASDWRVVRAPLRRCACAECAVVRSCEPAANADLFVRGYELYAHPPTDPREQRRQDLYAGWIAEAIAQRSPARVLDVGCGNGSLLLALGRRCPGASLAGCDPSHDSVRHGVAAGLALWPVSAGELPDNVQADLVLSVNVIEHLEDPVALLRSLRPRVSDGGLLVLICPDGARADVELLVSDHVYSFTREHLDGLVTRAGFAQRLWAPAPAALGTFQMAIAAPADTAGAAPTYRADHDVVREKAAYLQRWRDLDDQLLARLGAGSVVSFGMGEAAGLLRAYAPKAWSRVEAITADDLSGAHRFDAAPVALSDVPRESTVLVAVRPADQPRVADALRPRFSRVVTWYDLVTGDAT